MVEKLMLSIIDSLFNSIVLQKNAHIDYEMHKIFVVLFVIAYILSNVYCVYF